MRTTTRCAVATLLAATATLAAAQASVTVYGVLDVTAGRSKGAAGGVNSTDRSVTRLESGGMTTSHIGLRGTEDLGGGWSALFDLGSFIRVDTGATGRSDAIGAPVNVAADPFWSRSAWVGVASSTLGRIRLGNVTTLLFINSVSSNAFGDSTVFSPLNLVTFIGSPLSGGTGWSNSVVYDSPNWGGVTVSAARSLSENRGGSNAALRASYTKGPFTTSFAWQDVKKNPVTFADGTSANNTRAWQLAASYDFGAAVLHGHIGQIQNKGTEAAPRDVNYRVWEISVGAPVGAGRVLAGYARRTTGDTPVAVPATAAGGNLERSVFSVGYDHFLSKRTDVYAMALHNSTATRTVGAVPSTVNASGSNIGLGIRHRF
jgi:predicted porin